MTWTDKIERDTQARVAPFRREPSASPWVALEQQAEEAHERFMRRERRRRWWALAKLALFANAVIAALVWWVLR